MQALILKRVTRMTGRHFSQAKMVIDKNTNRLGRHNFSLPCTCSTKKNLSSLCRLHNLYFALLTQFFGNNHTPKQFGVKGFQNSPLFIHYLFFLVTKATVTSIVLP